MLKELRQNKEFRVFIWQLLDVILAFWITYLSWIEWEWKIIAAWLWVPILALITKTVNKKLGDLGVDKDLENTQ
jgi:hypothetical protein